MHQIQFCFQQHWLPVLAYVPASKWLAAAAYLAAALLSVLALRAGPDQRQQRSRKAYMRFWGLAAILLALLGLDKVVDLQSDVLRFVRCASQIEGWYAFRVPYQKLFTTAVVVAGVVLAAGIALYLRESLHSSALATIGVVLIVAYHLARAVSFHGVDVIIAMRVHGFSVNSIIELFGIAIIALNAAWLVVAQRRASR